MKRFSLFFTLVMLLFCFPTKALADRHDELLSNYLSLNCNCMPEADQLGSSNTAYSGLSNMMRNDFSLFVQGQNKVFHQYCSSRITDQELQLLIDWYESPLGKKYKNATTSSAFFVTVSRYLSRALMTTGFERHLVFVRDFDNRTRYSDKMAESAYTLMCVFADQFPIKELTTSTLGKSFRAGKEELIPLMKQEFAKVLLYQLRDFSEDELTVCANFYSSGAGKREFELFSSWIAGSGAIQFAEFIKAYPELAYGNGRLKESQLFDQPPVVTSTPPRVYPELARVAGIEGKVFVKALVDENGHVLKAEVVKRIPADCFIFDQEATRIVAESIYTPGQYQGKPVRVTITFPFRFTLQH